MGRLEAARFAGLCPCPRRPKRADWGPYMAKAILFEGSTLYDKMRYRFSAWNFIIKRERAERRLKSPVPGAGNMCFALLAEEHGSLPDGGIKYRLSASRRSID
jgi:hypothetical protein